MACEDCEEYRKDAEEADRDRREASAFLLGLVDQKDREILRLKLELQELRKN